jgi:hypothetical protein
MIDKQMNAKRFSITFPCLNNKLTSSAISTLNVIGMRHKKNNINKTAVYRSILPHHLLSLYHNKKNTPNENRVGIYIYPAFLNIIGLNIFQD